MSTAFVSFLANEYQLSTTRVRTTTQRLAAIESCARTHNELRFIARNYLLLEKTERDNIDGEDVDNLSLHSMMTMSQLSSMSMRENITLGNQRVNFNVV